MHFSKADESNYFQFIFWQRLWVSLSFQRVTVWSKDLQHQLDLGERQNSSPSNSPPDLLNQNLHFNQIFKEVGLPIKVLEALIPRAFVLKQRFLQHPPPPPPIQCSFSESSGQFLGILRLENYSFRFFSQLLPCSLRSGSSSQKQVKK